MMFISSRFLKLYETFVCIRIGGLIYEMIKYSYNFKTALYNTLSCRFTQQNMLNIVHCLYIHVYINPNMHETFADILSCV